MLFNRGGDKSKSDLNAVRSWVEIRTWHLLSPGVKSTGFSSSYRGQKRVGRILCEVVRACKVSDTSFIYIDKVIPNTPPTPSTAVSLSSKSLMVQLSRRVRILMGHIWSDGCDVIILFGILTNCPSLTSEASQRSLALPRLILRCQCTNGLQPVVPISIRSCPFSNSVSALFCSPDISPLLAGLSLRWIEDGCQKLLYSFLTEQSVFLPHSSHAGDSMYRKWFSEFATAQGAISCCRV